MSVVVVVVFVLVGIGVVTKSNGMEHENQIKLMNNTHFSYFVALNRSALKWRVIVAWPSKVFFHSGYLPHANIPCA